MDSTNVCFSPLRPSKLIPQNLTRVGLRSKKVEALKMGSNMRSIITPVKNVEIKCGLFYTPLKDEDMILRTRGGAYLHATSHTPIKRGETALKKTPVTSG